MNVRLFIYFICLISLLSCKSKDRKKYIHQVEHMETVLDSLHRIAFDSSMRNIDSIVVVMDNQLELIKSNLNSDTVFINFIKRIDRYKKVKNALNINTGNLAKVRQAIPTVQQKISDLKHDIVNGVNERDKYDEYIQFEQVKINEIKKVLTYYCETNSTYLTQFDTLHPVILHIIDSMAALPHE